MRSIRIQFGIMMVWASILCNSCVCTDVQCDEGFAVYVHSENSGPFPDGEYSLRWQAESKSGELEPTLEYLATGNVEFEFGSEIDESDVYITLEFYFNNESIRPAQTYSIDWATEDCNRCNGPADDQKVTNALISIELPPPASSN